MERGGRSFACGACCSAHTVVNDFDSTFRPPHTRNGGAAGQSGGRAGAKVGASPVGPGMQLGSATGICRLRGSPGEAIQVKRCGLMAIKC